jgi:hypothetical protein
MRRTPRYWLVAVAGFWLAAGPVGLTLRAIAECRHDAAHGQHGSSSHAPVPAGDPCFCSHMTSGSDILLAPVLPAPMGSPAAIAAPVRALPFPLPPSPFPGFSPTPETPPPNAPA